MLNMVSYTIAVSDYSIGKLVKIGRMLSPNDSATFYLGLLRLSGKGCAINGYVVKNKIKWEWDPN